MIPNLSALSLRQDPDTEAKRSEPDSRNDQVSSFSLRSKRLKGLDHAEAIAKWEERVTRDDVVHRFDTEWSDPALLAEFHGLPFERVMGYLLRLPNDERGFACLSTTVDNEEDWERLSDSSCEILIKWASTPTTAGSGMAQMLIKCDDVAVVFFDGELIGFQMVQGSRFEYDFVTASSRSPLVERTGTFGAIVFEGTHLDPRVLMEGKFIGDLLVSGVQKFYDGTVMEGLFDTEPKRAHGFTNGLMKGKFTSPDGVVRDLAIQGQMPVYKIVKTLLHPTPKVAVFSAAIPEGVWLYQPSPQLRARVWKVPKDASGTFRLVQDFMARPDPQLGRGRDRKEHDEPFTLELLDLYRVEYTADLRKNYTDRRDAIAKEACTNFVKPVAAETDDIFAGTTVLGGLKADANEKLLFHGTSRGVIDSIVANVGFATEQTNSGWFGRAWYFAEKPGKSDEYTTTTHAPPRRNLVDRTPSEHPKCVKALSPERKAYDDVRYLMLVRVTLGCAARVNKSSFENGRTRYSGKSFLTDHARKEHLSEFGRRQRDIGGMTSKDLAKPFDSVVFNDLTQGRYKEFMVFNELQAIPAYIVAYRRAPKAAAP